MNKLRLQFSSNDTDEDEGLSDAGIETFKGVPYSSVARESAQNSRDAALTFPVRLEFDVVQIPRSEFPALQELTEVVKACASRAEERNELKEKQFFSKAQNILGEEVLYSLRISDEGTTGLLGPCISGKPFHSLVKSSGVSNKNDPTSGGSYGIGKRAAYAISDLHTVFYATSYEENGEYFYLTQGKCTLVSHERGGKKFKATGYWGAPNYLPVTTPSDAPSWLHKDKIGTTTHSIGFSASSDWKYRIAESLVRNFFTAIHRGELEFLVDDQSLRIDKDTLGSVLNNLEVSGAAEAQGTTEDFEFSKVLYECLLDAQTKQFNVEIPEIGAFVMHLLVKEELPKRLAIVRNGMIITDNLQRFGDKLSHFPMYKDFAAIVEPSDTRGKTTIKRLENPEHNDLSVDRLIDEAEQRSVRKGMNSLKKWIRDSIRSEALVVTKDDVSLDEMNEFFGDISNADRLPSEGDGDTHPLTVTYKPNKPKRQPPIEGGVADEDDDDPGDGGGGAKPNDASGGNPLGEGARSGDGSGGSAGEMLAFEEFRNVRDQNDPKISRTLYFTPLSSGFARLRVVANGINNNVAFGGVTVIDEHGLPVTAFPVKAGVRQRLTVRFPITYEGPINMQLHKCLGSDHEAT